MLDRASPADGEMRAERLDPVRTRHRDPQQAAAVGVTRHRRHLDRLAGKRIGHVDRLSADDGDAVAVMADMVDGEMFTHGARR